MKRALIIVDVQLDFCEDGALPVKGGDRVAERVMNYLENEVERYYDRVVFTQDWHKPWPNTNGGHFGDPPDYKDSWPVHCVAGSEGARLHPAIEDVAAHYGPTFKKGFGRPDYSGFQGVNEKGETLLHYFDTAGIKEAHVVGLAGDYCVRETALDAKSLGFKSLVLPEMVASVGGPMATANTIYLVSKP